MRSGEQPEGGGVLEGGVEKIGWNDQYIVALRHATFRGDPDGWMKIDVHTKQITGPISEGDAIMLLSNQHPRVAKVAWEDL